MKKVLLMVGVIMFAFISCSREKDDPVIPWAPPPPGQGSPVNFDFGQVPYTNLSAYNFFEGVMADLAPVQGVLPYDVNTSLFSDYAKKDRFIWMPPGVKAQYVADDKAFHFGDGTVLIKNFYYENVLPGNSKRMIETRLMFKRAGLWEFANYVWNTDQTEATLDMGGSFTPVTWTEADGTQRSTTYRIPSAAECLTCHKVDLLPIPIGPKPQNIKGLQHYPEGAMEQMDKWTQVGYLHNGYPTNIATTVKWDDVSESLHDRVRAYLDMNCAHCHADDKHCDYRAIRLAWSGTSDMVNLGVCVTPDESFNPTLTHIVASGNIQRSMMHFRMSTTQENMRMPLLGRTLVHEEALQLVEEWINTLGPPCN